MPKHTLVESAWTTLPGSPEFNLAWSDLALNMPLLAAAAAINYGLLWTIRFQPAQPWSDCRHLDPGARMARFADGLALRYGLPEEISSADLKVSAE